MAPILLAIVLAATDLPDRLGEVEPWFQSRTEQEVWQSLESADPNSPAAIRALDLRLTHFRSREQSYLLKNWTNRFKTTDPDSALALRALAWRAWMLPEGLRDSEDALELETRLAQGNHAPVWEEILESLPNSLSAVISARMILASEETIPSSLDRFRSTSPESAIAAYLSLREGETFAKRREWERAADAWLNGIENYPLDWEIPDWIERIRQALLASGHRVEAEILAEGSRATARRIRDYRTAIARDRRGDRKEAMDRLRELADRPEISPELRELCLAHLLVHGDMSMSGDSTLEIPRALANAPKDRVPKLLLELEAGDSSPLLARSLLTIAGHRSNRGEVGEAVLMWDFLSKNFESESKIAANAHRRLVEAHMRRWTAIRRLRSTFANGEFDSFFSPFEAAHREAARRELEERLERAERFAASANYSAPLLELIDSLYRAHSELGHKDRPQNLFQLHADRVPEDIREVLAERARLHRPEEAIAILRIEAVSAEANLSPDERENLLSLYENSDRFREAAAIARAIAEEASGTPHENDAWYKTAWLEYRSTDYENSRRTLEELLPKQEPGTIEHAETSRLLGLTNYRVGDYEAARGQFDTALESGLLDKKTREELGLLHAYSHLYRQEYSEARARLKTVLEDSPSRLTERSVQRLIRKLDTRN